MAKGRIEVDQVFDPELLETVKDLRAALNTLAEDIKKNILAGKLQAQTIEELNKIEQKQLELEASLSNSKGKAVKKQQEYTAEVAKARLEEQKRRRELDLTAKINDSFVGSLDRARARLALMTIQAGKSKVAFQELQPKIQRLSTEVKKMEAAMGDSRRNVGNYQSALQGLGGELQAQTGRLGQFAAMFAKAGPIGLAVGGLAAAISAPFVAFFTLTEKGMERLERGAANTKAAFSVLGGELARIGEKLIGEEGKPSGFGKFVALVATLPSMMLSQVSPSFKMTAKSMSDAGEVAAEYTRKMQELEEAESAAAVTRSEVGIDLAKARLLYKEGVISEANKKALEDVIALENKQAKVDENLNLIRVNALKDMEKMLMLNGLTAEAEGVRFQINEAQVKVNNDIAESTLRVAKATGMLVKMTKELNEAKVSGMRSMPTTGTGSISDPNIDISTMSAQQQAEDAIYWKEREFETIDELDRELHKNKMDDIEEEKQARQDERDAMIQGMEQTANVLDAVGGLGDVLYENKILQIEESGKSEIEKEKKIAEIKHKQAVWDKAQGLVQATIAGAIGIIQSIGKGALMVAFAIAQAALNIATIAAQKIPDIPKFFRGVMSAPGGASWVGEQGRELITLPSGDQLLTPEHATLLNLPAHSEVMPNDVLRAELAGMQNSRGYSHVKTDLQREMLSALIQIRDNEQYDLGDYVVIRKGNSERRIRKNR